MIIFNHLIFYHLAIVLINHIFPLKYYNLSYLFNINQSNYNVIIQYLVLPIISLLNLINYFIIYLFLKLILFLSFIFHFIIILFLTDICNFNLIDPISISNFYCLLFKNEINLIINFILIIQSIFFIIIIFTIIHKSINLFIIFNLFIFIIFLLYNFHDFIYHYL